MPLHPRSRRPAALFAVALAAALAPTRADAAAWVWSMGGDGVSAAGTFTATDAPDASGFVRITGITGTRNGVAITGLQPAGTAIPGNGGFPVDDLLGAGAVQLTVEGFGFALADGTFSNPYYADFQSPPAYYEFFSFPPFDGSSFAEVSVAFTAAPVPEPATAALLLAGLAGLAAARRRPDRVELTRRFRR